MKKVFSFALALVLLFTMCISVFAIDLTAGTSAGSTTVLVDGTARGATYTVTIPAEAQIAWGQEEKSVDYSVFSQLETGKHVKVTVTADGVMKNDNGTATLNYSLKSGTTEFITTESVILSSNPEKSNVVVVISENNWNYATIDKYTGTLTFEAEIV